MVSGLIDADSDVGHMSFGDLNINVHGFRASLHDSIDKLFEETYQDLNEAMEKKPAVLSDTDRVFELFVKVCLMVPQLH